MKIMVASDIHGSALYCRKMLDAFEREQADRLLLLGDLLYHGPRNDLPAGYAPKEVIPLLNAQKNRLLCVRGNCDTEVDQMVLEFPIMAESCILWLGSRMVFATHGHHFNTASLPPCNPAISCCTAILMFRHGSLFPSSRHVLHLHRTALPRPHQNAFT